MKIKKCIITKETCDINIEEVTLLSVEEASKVSNELLNIGVDWWLSSPGSAECFAVFVRSDGAVSNYGNYVDDFYCVRPVLRFGGSGAVGLGDKIEVVGEMWTVISDGVALCDRVVGECAFRDDYDAFCANVYDTSDVKKWLDVWASKKGLAIRHAEPAAVETDTMRG